MTHVDVPNGGYSWSALCTLNHLAL